MASKTLAALALALGMHSPASADEPPFVDYQGAFIPQVVSNLTGKIVPGVQGIPGVRIPKENLAHITDADRLPGRLTLKYRLINLNDLRFELTDLDDKDKKNGEYNTTLVGVDKPFPSQFIDGKYTITLSGVNDDSEIIPISTSKWNQLQQEPSNLEATIKYPPEQAAKKQPASPAQKKKAPIAVSGKVALPELKKAPANAAPPADVQKKINADATTDIILTKAPADATTDNVLTNVPADAASDAPLAPPHNNANNTITSNLFSFFVTPHFYAASEERGFKQGEKTTGLGERVHDLFRHGEGLTLGGSLNKIMLAVDFTHEKIGGQIFDGTALALPWQDHRAEQFGDEIITKLTYTGSFAYAGDKNHLALNLGYSHLPNSLRHILIGGQPIPLTKDNTTFFAQLDLLLPRLVSDYGLGAGGSIEHLTASQNLDGTKTDLGSGIDADAYLIVNADFADWIIGLGATIRSQNNIGYPGKTLDIPAASSFGYNWNATLQTPLFLNDTFQAGIDTAYPLPQNDNSRTSATLWLASPYGKASIAYTQKDINRVGTLHQKDRSFSFGYEVPINFTE